jgi:hypothetical protein
MYLIQAEYFSSPPNTTPSGEELINTFFYTFCFLLKNQLTFLKDQFQEVFLNLILL